MTFNGIVTTGIYCRDGCPGRPRAEHRRYFDSVAAAEAAGFRPCLRCRPDRQPPSSPPSDAPQSVQEAVQLIADGYLDRRSEAALAERVGYSARQLRRRFLLHVGATPSFVASSRRAHFARRLLDETDLSMARIASAAGFGSTRQMRRVVNDIFRFAPEQLRARRGRAGRRVLDGGLRLHIPYAPPFDFQAALKRMSVDATPGIEVVEDRLYRRTFVAHDQPAVLEVRDAADGHHLELIAHLPTWRLLIEDVAACRRVFRLDTDDGMPGAWDAFEGAARRLLRVAYGAAAPSVAGCLVARFGRPLPEVNEPGLTHLFPTAERLAQATQEEFAPCALAPEIEEALRDIAHEAISQRSSVNGASA